MTYYIAHLCKKKLIGSSVCVHIMYISLWIHQFCLCGKGWESYLIQIIIIATLILKGLLIHSTKRINLMTVICNFILQFCVLRERTYEKQPSEFLRKMFFHGFFQTLPFVCTALNSNVFCYFHFLLQFLNSGISHTDHEKFIFSPTTYKLFEQIILYSLPTCIVWAF